MPRQLRHHPRVLTTGRMPGRARCCASHAAHALSPAASTGRARLLEESAEDAGPLVRRSTAGERRRRASPARCSRRCSTISTRRRRSPSCTRCTAPGDGGRSAPRTSTLLGFSGRDAPLSTREARWQRCARASTRGRDRGADRLAPHAARAAKNFAESDRIRDELAALGIVVKDDKDPKTGETTTWEVGAMTAARSRLGAAAHLAGDAPVLAGDLPRQRRWS